MNRRNMPTVAELNSNAVVPRQCYIPNVRQMLRFPDDTHLLQDVVDRGTSPINFDAPRQDRGTSPLSVHHVVGLLETVQHNLPVERRHTNLTLRDTRKRRRQQDREPDEPEEDDQDEREGPADIPNYDPRIKYEIPDEELMRIGRKDRFETELRGSYRQRNRLFELRFVYGKTYDEVPIPDLNTSLEAHIDNLELEWRREREEARLAAPVEIQHEPQIEFVHEVDYPDRASPASMEVHIGIRDWNRELRDEDD